MQFTCGRAEDRLRIFRFRIGKFDGLPPIIQQCQGPNSCSESCMSRG